MKVVNKEEYKRIIGQVYAPLLEKADSIKESEYRDFLKKIIEAAERSLRSLLFTPFREFEFKKEISENDVSFWLEKVSLVLISYSYYSIVSVKSWYDLKNIYLNKIPHEVFFEAILKYYNRVFDKRASLEDINYYSEGYKETIEKRLVETPENLKKIVRRDYRVIGAELLAGVWGEDIDEDKWTKKQGIFLGEWIWQTHEKIIIPFLQKITLTDEAEKIKHVSPNKKNPGRENLP